VASDQVHAETRRADEVTARADRDRASAENAIGALEARLVDSIARVAALDRQLTSTREQLDTSHTAQARLEAQLGAATQRADEANARTDRADTARADADRDRVAAEKSATRLETQLEQAHRPHRRPQRRPRPAHHQPDPGHPGRGARHAGR